MHIHFMRVRLPPFSPPLDFNLILLCHFFPSLKVSTILLPLLWESSQTPLSSPPQVSPPAPLVIKVSDHHHQQWTFNDRWPDWLFPTDFRMMPYWTPPTALPISCYFRALPSQPLRLLVHGSGGWGGVLVETANYSMIFNYPLMILD